MGGCKIFAGGLPKAASEEVITAYFASWGPVRDIQLKYTDQGEPRGFAFVTFESPEVAEAVVANYDHNSIDGKWIDCKPADGKGMGGGKAMAKGGGYGGGKPDMNSMWQMMEQM